MSEVQQQTVQESHAAPLTTHETVAPTTLASEASTDPIRSQETTELSPESRPEIGSGLTDSTAAAAPTAPNVTNVPKEEKVGKGEVLVESKPINEGILNYKGPGLKGLIFSKKYFWLSDSPLEHKHLSAYLGNEKSKDIAHPNAAHAQQTGKGLLFFAKRAEDKDHPQGIFNLADITDVVKANFNEFGFTIHGHKHLFQAVTKAEKDAWIVTLETKASEAKNSREDIVGSSGYKSALEKYGTPAAAASTGTSRSLSRPGKKASKSRERKGANTKTDTSTPATNNTNTTDPASVASEGTPVTATEGHGPTSTAEKPGEVVAGGAAAGAVAGVATHRSGSTSDEDKKTKKSRSQSRNKRGSLFGNLLGKKEDHDAKKEIKKEEKEEKKEEKAEEKAIAKEVKKEEKIEKKEEKLEAKAEKKELKREAEEAKQLESESNPESTGQTPGFNAHAIASRVVGEPVVPAAEGASTGVSDTTPANGVESTTAPVISETAPTSTITTKDAAPKQNKRASIFGGFFGKKDTATATPTTAETAPVVPAKDEPSTVSNTAPQLDNPVSDSPTEPATGTTGTAASETPAAAAGSTTPGATTTPTDKRRSSFFSNLGTKKERRTGATSGDELTDGEGKKQSQGGFSGLLRKASRAQKGSSGAKDPANVPLPKEPTSAPTAPTENSAQETSGLTDGEVNSAPAEAREQAPVSAAA